MPCQAYWSFSRCWLPEQIFFHVFNQNMGMQCSVWFQFHSSESLSSPSFHAIVRWNVRLVVFPLDTQCCNICSNTGSIENQVLHLCEASALMEDPTGFYDGSNVSEVLKIFSHISLGSVAFGLLWIHERSITNKFVEVRALKMGRARSMEKIEMIW